MNWEQKLQEAVVQYIKITHPNALFTASAGGMRVSMATAVKMKRAGYSKGFPDIVVFEPRVGFHGLAIELKTEKTAYSSKGTIKPEQIEWRDKLIERGYEAFICFGMEEACRVIDRYLVGTNNQEKCKTCGGLGTCADGLDCSDCDGKGIIQ